MREEIYAGTAPGVKPVLPAEIEQRAGYERGVHCEPCWNRRKRVTPANGRWGSMPYCNPCRIDDRVPHREWRTGVEAEEPAAPEQPQDEPLARVKTMTAVSPAARAAMGKSNPVHPLAPSESADEIRREVEADIEKKRSTFVGKFDAAKCLCGCGSAVFGGRKFFRGHKGRVATIPASIQTAKVTKETKFEEKSEMPKLCKCGCGNQAPVHRDYIWGHKTKAPTHGAKPAHTVAAIKVRTPAAPAVDPDAVVEKIAIMVSPVYLDEFWRNRSLSEKARMVSNFFAEAGV